MKYIWSILALSAVAASSCCAADQLSTNVVIRSFQQQASAIAAAQTNTNLATFLTGKIADSAHLYAQPTTFSNCFRRIDGTLSSEERKNLILKGEIKDLKRNDKCWVVESFGGFGSEISGYLDFDRKKLILFWIMPEG